MPISRPISKRLRQSGTALLLGTVSLLMVIPIAGLAIDVGFLYAVKSRLQASVDGSALAAARALNLGQTVAAQSGSAKQNAVNWFYSNFPNGNWATKNTMMGAGTVLVFDDPVNANLRNVTVTATTTVPTYFMRWLNFSSTVITSTGNANRRDVVIMIVLDRSTSMQSSPGACQAMKDAAKIFTGQFSANRDRIGLLSFSDGTFLHSSPTQNFQAVLGYSNGSGSGTGAIDTVQCTGGTNSAQAISVAYNELRRTNLPGALNIILFESDGLPNSLTLRFWDTTTNLSGLANLAASGCKDANNNRVGSGGGWNSSSEERQWLAAKSFGSGSWLTTVPAGAYGVLWASDTSGVSAPFLALGQPWHPDANNYGLGGDHLASASTPGCMFNNPASGNQSGDNPDSDKVTDIAWIPRFDVFGNDLKPSNAYKPVTLTGGGKVDFTGSTATKWTNFRNGAFNAADNAAYRARTNTTLAASLFAIGLGGYTSPPDYTLMQRIANDPDGDNFNSPAKYSACAVTPNCVNYIDQPRGTFIFSNNQNDLRQAFLKLSSQILRLSR